METLRTVDMLKPDELSCTEVLKVAFLSLLFCPAWFSAWEMLEPRFSPPGLQPCPLVWNS